MRITCPNCSSQYEVGEDAIPAAGRDVQCAKCSHIWFEAGPSAPMVLSAEPVAKTPAEPQAQPAFRSSRVDRDAVEAAPEPAPVTEPATAAEPAPAPEAAPEVAAEPAAEADMPPTSLTDDIKRILNEERDFSEGAEEPPAPAADPAPAPEAAPIPTAEPTPAPEVAESAEPAAPADEGLTLDAAPRMFEQAQPEQAPVAEEIPAAAPVDPAPIAEPIPEQPAAAQNLSEARSLREVLDAEAQDNAAQADVATVQEPTLSDLGLRRPAPVAAEPLPEAQPAPAVDTPSAAEGRAREAFTNIDDLNSKLDRQTQTNTMLDEPSGLDIGEAVPTTSPFAVGFAVACFICITATLIYVMGPRISGSVPAMAGFADTYTASVDSGRMVLQELYYGGEGEPGFDNLFRNLTGG